MNQQALGSMIGASFGLVYILVNAGSLPTVVGVPVRLFGVLAFVVVVVPILRRRHAGPSTGRPPAGASRPGFGKAYWLLVAAEAIAIIVGVRVLAGPLDVPYAGVAWVSLVVGLHFFPLASILGVPPFRWLGAGIAGCGVVGLALAAGGASEPPIAAIGGVLPGVLLLLAGWWGATHRAPAAERRPS